MKSKKIEVYEDHNSLAITMRWYTPKAFFLLFFSIFWNVFLLFWYTVAFGVGAPLIAKLFPLLHVGVGLWLIYYTACLFVNKTWVDVVDDYLMIQHRPIPWWKGNREIPIEEIQQIYVKKKTRSGKNGTYETFQLRAKMKNGEDEELIAIDDASSEQLLQIERHLEQFAGIEDQPVKGEYGNTGSTKHRSKVKSARRAGRNLPDSVLKNVYLSEAGEWITIRETELKIISVNQYDWKDGNSDKLFQLIGSDSVEKLLYFEQNKGLLNSYWESSILLADALPLKFTAKEPPTSIRFEDTLYYLSNHESGDHYVSGTQNSLAVEHWRFTSTDGKRFLRIVDNQGMMEYYKGERLAVEDFDRPLDLNRWPEQEVERRAQELNDEDLV